MHKCRCHSPVNMVHIGVICTRNHIVTLIGATVRIFTRNLANFNFLTLIDLNWKQFSKSKERRGCTGKMLKLQIEIGFFAGNYNRLFNYILYIERDSQRGRGRGRWERGKKKRE